MKNCVFCKSNNKCIALVEKKCERCSFAKTAEQLNFGRQCAMRRIKSLPEKQRNYINDKYYYGRLV